MDRALLRQIIRVLFFLLLIYGTPIYAEKEIGESIQVKRYFSPILRTELIDFQQGFRSFKLHSENILKNSETVAKEGHVFERNFQYHFDYERGIIHFTEEMPEVDWVEIEYSIIPEEIRDRFYYFLTVDYSDSLVVKTPPRERFRLGFTDTQLNITGSKSFAVSVGSDEDFSINQSLFLRLDGELRRNLRIQAQLSDSQSPLTPEGDTRELSSLDQIFIKLYGNEYEVAFGDLDITYSNTEFINYYGRFEGIKGEWYGRNRFQGALAIAKGKDHSNEFRGKDGKQGPYFLTVPNLGTGIQIIPGSETVYLNGVTMYRGTDYTIEYSTGSITFTARHFIDSNSLIYVRFQYSDQDYRQNMYFTASEIELTDRLTLSHHIIIRNDDKRNPLQETFSAEDRQILKEAGDNPAWAEGVIEVEPGEGLYILTTDGDLEYYEYVGSGADGNYLVHFSYVGVGKGDYRQVTPQSFEYVGQNEGSWLPVRLLPSPQYLANYDIALGWGGDFYQVRGEYIFTRNDQNTFSSLDSDDNNGHGTHWQMSLFPDFNRIEPNWMIYYRYLSENLATFADIRDPEMSYDFYEIAAVDTVASQEIGTELSMNIEDFIKPQVRYIRKNADESYKRDNFVFNTMLSQKSIIPSLNYRYSYARQSSESLDEREMRVENNQVNTTYQLNRFQLGGSYQRRIFRDSYLLLSDDDLYSETTIFGRASGLTDRMGYFNRGEAAKVRSGSRYQNRGLTFGTYRTRSVAGQLYVRKEHNDIFDEGWTGLRESVTFGGESYIDIAEQRLRLNYSRREVKHIQQGGESKYDMAEINLNNTLLNRGINLFSNYTLRNVEFYPYVRDLIYVGKTLGIYDSTGVVTDDGEYDYIMVQVGDPEMSIEVNADLMLNITPRFFISQGDENGREGFSKAFNDFLRRVQLESYFLIMENSRASEKWDIYLLKPSMLMNEENTIYGRNVFRQTLWFDIVRGRVLSKIAYNRDRAMDNRYQESHRTDITAQELMFRFSRFFSSDFEFTYENRTEEETRYDSRIESDSFTLDIRNRLSPNAQLTSVLRYSEESGDSTAGGVSYALRSYGLTESISYFFQRRYRVFGRIEYRRNERKGSGFLAFLPEKREGNIFRWSFRLNYQLNPFTSGGVEYSGNNFPLQDTVHQMKVEVRAEF